ncbi:MAG: sugar phosphate isomerase/epimerase [Clostridia bacterium]|nr:sugar phosphate isomerase/epimerase [Clostridia bacterium]
MDYSIQLYSCRDAMKENMEATLKKIAEIGYTLVEPAGFFDHTAEEFKAMIDNYGLKVSGTHTGWPALDDENFDATVKFHKTIGTQNIIIPGFGFGENREQLEDFIAFVNKVQPKLEAEGMKLAYHNHSGEFIPTVYGAMVHKEIEERTNVDFEIDTYWAFNAGLDPVETLERLKNRVHFIHIKDGFMGGKGKPLGLGEAPVAAVYEKALELGMQMVVESETQDPDGLTEAEICFKYLKSLEK